MKNKKTIIIFSSIILLIIVISALFFINKPTKADVNLPQQTLKDLKEFNQKLDEYYITTWDNNQFLSSYSYLVKKDGTEVTIDDLQESLGYQVPEQLKDVSIHFVAPKSLKPYLGDKILDDDPDILTVYSALPVEGGMFISSKFDEGGVLSNEDYKKFVTEHSWAHGEIKTPSKDDKDYKEILNAIEKKDIQLKGGNVKYIACDDKYAIIVISSSEDPSYIKQYALQKNEDGSYNVIKEDLQEVNSKIFVNYAYTDFELGLLPPYEINAYSNISSDQQYVVESLKESGDINKDEQLTYSCGAGNFIYLEFKSNLKVLLYKNENGSLDFYQVDNFKTALAQMLKLEPNPPVFILNFE
nr:hypothetical protein [uncultured Tyzzerella sp.]